MNYNWICTPICTKILFLQKVGVTDLDVGPKMKVAHFEVIYHRANIGYFWSSISAMFIFYKFGLV
jgi:hypothetical protein